MNSHTNDMEPQKPNFKIFLLHFFAIVIFLVIEFITYIALQANPFSAETYFTYALYIASFYFNAYILLHFFEGSQFPIIKSIIFISVHFFIAYTLFLFINLTLSDIKYVDLDNDQAWIFHVKGLYRLAYFFYLSFGFYFALSSIKKTKESANLRQDKLEVENAVLRLQINPHMLFNSLNFIYGTIRSKPEQAESAILKLSELMVYALGDTNKHGLVLLMEETYYLTEYISLYRLITPREINLTIDIEKLGKLDERRFLPLVLISLVENIFKHGALHDKENPASISLKLINSEMHFLTRNVIRDSPFTASNNIGLTNVTSRLRNQYAGRFSLKTNNENGIYALDLIVEL